LVIINLVNQIYCFLNKISDWAFAQIVPCPR